MRRRDKLALGVLGTGLGLALWAGGVLAQGWLPPGAPPAGGFAPPPGGAPPGPPPSESDRGAMEAGMRAALDLLGLPADQFGPQAQGGRSLADLAAARGIDRDTLVATMNGATGSYLADQVSAGRLAQGDAEATLQRTQDFTVRMVSAPPPPLPGGGQPFPPPGGGPPPGMSFPR